MVSPIAMPKDLNLGVLQAKEAYLVQRCGVQGCGPGVFLTPVRTFWLHLNSVFRMTQEGAITGPDRKPEGFQSQLPLHSNVFSDNQ